MNTQTHTHTHAHMRTQSGGRDNGSLVASSVSSLMGNNGRGGRSARGLDIRELVRALLGLAVMVGSGPAALQLAPLMALGHLQHEHYSVCVFVCVCVRACCVCAYVWVWGEDWVYGY